ncbi:MAG: hypothetical protein J6J36_08995 [Clostridia bacterium]|nr:hypothetical protein [Clostridia bacterium]
MSTKDKNLKYRNAFCEVLFIIENLSEENKSKISKDFINFLERNKNKDFSVTLPKDALEHEELLSKETKIIISMIYRDYFCNDEEKAEFDKTLIENEIEKENEAQAKYSVDRLFKNYKRENLDEAEETMQLMLYEEAKWYKKIWIKIRSLFIK